MPKVPAPLQHVADKVHEKGKAKRVRVRELLSWYGAQRRGVLVVRQIRAGLKRVKLVTEPDFEVAYIDELVRLKAIDSTAKDPAFDEKLVDERAPGTDVTYVVVIGGSVADPAPRIGMLKAANTPPVAVNRDTEISEAITLMLMNDYSQLPVMQSERSVDGLVSWRSIGKARIADGKAAKFVRDCMEPVEVISSDTHLFDAVNTIAKKEVVLVRNNENRIAGLVTTSDISLQFGSLSEPFLLLSEIENHVRRLIDGKFSLPQLTAARDPSDATRKIDNVANLTFGEYIRLLDKPDNWSRLGYALSRVECTKRLREVGRIRNDVMHFHPDGISDEDMELLRDTRNFLQNL